MTDYIDPEASAADHLVDDDHEPKRSWWQRRSRSMKIGIIASSAAVLTLIGGATAYGVYYGAGARALPGTTVGDISVSGMTQAQVAGYVEKHAASHTVTISADGIPETRASLADLGVTVDAKETAKKALAANSNLGAYFAAPFTSTRIEPVISVDNPHLSEYANKLSEGVEGAEPATEPSVAPAEDQSSFAVVDGKNGHGLAIMPLVDAATASVTTNTDQRVRASLGEIEPLISRDKAEAQAEQANALVSPPVTIKAGEEAVTPDAAQRVSWVQVPGLSETDTTPTLSDEAVKNWVTELSGKLTKKRVDGLRYVNENGDEVLQKIQPVNGVSVTNVDQITSGIIEAASAGKDFESAFETAEDTAEWKSRVIAPGAEKLAYPAAPGEKWIDVNLSANTTTAYVGSTVVRGPVLVGKGTPQTPTVTGRYVIERKVRSDTMRGRNVDGTPYRVDNVPYAMYFHGGYALHGAPWMLQGGPGVDISHGCINMPVGEAGWFFNWAPPGTVVVSHY